ncbi:SufD family Fe-S cluster assembly protein [Candidatus Babeliales bacterium]|nr:SufD family Fe-S cluster assembly protein [Candidatus Babeliales bacterium]
MEILLSNSGTFYLKKIVEKYNVFGDIEIKIEKNINISLVDDLFLDGVVINFLLKNNSSLFYSMKFRNKYDEISKSLKFSFIGQGSSAQINCIYEGEENSVLRLNTVQHHFAMNSVSDLCVKSVLHGSSKLFCKNLIRIEKNAQRVRAKEENKNLLLGELARVVSIPKLEVEAEDVSCQHGAAISNISDEDIFYLQSRGMNLNEAKQLFITGFLNEVI